MCSVLLVNVCRRMVSLNEPWRKCFCWGVFTGSLVEAVNLICLRESIELYITLRKRRIPETLGPRCIPDPDQHVDSTGITHEQYLNPTQGDPGSRITDSVGPTRPSDILKRQAVW